nr:SRPBCC domain-containing protein [Actinomycetota bacterium]
MDATLRTDAGRCVLRLERVFAHPPEKVWRAITEPGHLEHWSPARLDGQRRAGERITFTFPDSDGGAGTITDYDPPRLFAFTWEDDTLRCEVRP